ncbi:MAG: oligosaccharide flippase family protein [Pseudomonadota bacterium]
MTSNPVDPPAASARLHGYQLAVGSLQGFIGSAVSLPTGILTAAFLSRQLGPEQYGVLSVVCSLVLFVEIAITLGFERAAVKLTAETVRWEAALGGVLRVQLMASIAAALLVIAAAPLIALWMKSGDIAFYLRIYAVGIPIAGLAKIHQAALVGRGYFSIRAWLNGGYWVVRLVLVLVMVPVSPSVTAVIIANMTSAAVVLAVARIFVKPAIRSPHPEICLKRVWAVAGSLYFFTLCIHLSQAMDLVFVKAWTAADSAGFFAAAENLAIVPSLVAIALTPVLLSKLSHLLAGGGTDVAGRLLGYAIRFVVCLLPFAGMSAGAAGEIVRLVYGDRFLPAAPLLSVLIFGALGLTLTQVNASGLIAAGKTLFPLCFLGPLIPLAAVAHFFFIREYGALGAAGVTAVISGFTAIGTGVAVSKTWRLLFQKSLWVYNLVLTAAAFSVAALWETAGVLLLVKLLLMSIGIVFALWILGELSFFNPPGDTLPVWAGKRK